MDKSNQFIVGFRPSSDRPVVIHAWGQWLTVDEAVNLAAWLVALADPERARFDGLLNEVLES